MQLAALSEISRPYRHVYLSPHLDDAALSCGGAIQLHLAADQPVLVVVICTATPPPEMQFSALATEFHASWKLSPAEAVAARLAEERLAMERMAVDYIWVDRFDAIYRYPQAYNSRETLFNQPAEGDPLLPDLRQLFTELAAALPMATFYSPLGVGSHVDHLQTYRAASEVLGERLRYYEDYPYVQLAGSLEQRQAQLGRPMVSHTAAIDGVLSAKIAAIAAYSSQLGELFGGTDAMARKVSAYANQIRPADAQYGERIWWF